MVVIGAPDVDTALLGGRLDLRGASGNPGQHGVEEGVVHHLHAGLRQARRQRPGVLVHPPRYPAQSLGAVVGGIHRRHHRQQHLRGADVRRRFVAPDVLLAGLQREPVGRRAVGVDGHPDQPAGQLAGVTGVGGQVAGVRAAETHRHTEPLGAAEGHVGADLTGRRDQRDSQQVGADRHQRTPVVRLGDQCRPVGHPAAGARHLGDHPEEVAVGQAVAQVGGDDLDPQRFGAGGQHRVGLDEDVAVHRQPVRRSLARPVHQRHGLGRRGGLVEHGRVGDVQPGQVGDHGLEVQQRLQPALADLRLVGRVGGVPRRVLHDVAQQHRRGQRVVVALADHRHRDHVRVGQLPQFGQCLVFGGRIGQGLQPGGDTPVGQRVQDPGGQCLGGQFIERADADDAEDVGQRLAVQADVAGVEAGLGRPGGPGGVDGLGGRCGLGHGGHS